MSCCLCNLPTCMMEPCGKEVCSLFCPSVQKQSIPVLLEGRDALVRSQTGSGQLLFVYPAIYPEVPSLWSHASVFRKVFVVATSDLSCLGKGSHACF